MNHPGVMSSHLVGVSDDDLTEMTSRFEAERLAENMKIMEAESAILAENRLIDFVRLGWNHGIAPDAFVDGWHLTEICEHLDAVLRGEIDRIAFMLPPGHGKSSTVSVALVPYAWLKFPWLRFVYLSYSAELTTRDSVTTRGLIQSDWYQGHWKDRYEITADQNAKTRYINTKGGYRFSTSFGGTLTGWRGDIWIADDPHNWREAESDVVREGTVATWIEAVPNRINATPPSGTKGNPRARIVVQQRVHEKDVIGLCAEMGYTVVCLPARYEHDHPNVYPMDPRKIDGEPLWPELYDDARLKRDEEDHGPYAFAALYQQRPTPRAGGFFKRDWFPDSKLIDKASDVPYGRTVRYWDLAGTEESVTSRDPDWTVGTKCRWVDGVMYLIDQQVFRQDPAGVEAEIKAIAKLDGRTVEVAIEEEPGASGKTVTSHFQRTVLRGYTVWGDRPTGDKADRARPIAALARGGLLRMVRAPWNRGFVDEACTFPRGAHKDRIDSVSGAFKILAEGGEITAAKLKGW